MLTYKVSSASRCKSQTWMEGGARNMAETFYRLHILWVLFWLDTTRVYSSWFFSFFQRKIVNSYKPSKPPQTPANGKVFCTPKSAGRRDLSIFSPSSSPAPSPSLPHTPTLDQSGPFRHETLEWLREEKRKWGWNAREVCVCGGRTEGHYAWMDRCWGRSWCACGDGCGWMGVMSFVSNSYRDKNGRSVSDPDYNPRTLLVLNVLLYFSVCYLITWQTKCVGNCYLTN